MRSYHLAQEQALEIAKQTLTLPTYTNALKSELQAYVNAALDKVLGGPVAEVIGLSKDEKIHSLDWDYEHIKNLRVGTKLYAPKEQS